MDGVPNLGSLTVQSESVMYSICSMRDMFLKEKHDRGLDGHFGHDKKYAQLSYSYYWRGMRYDVKTFVEKCRIYYYAKRKQQNTGL